MTGTGTQTDPYIVSIWADFVTAIGIDGAYVECVPNTIWDMNEIAPSGINESTVNCSSIEGNGATINNLFISSANLLTFSKACVINRLNIINYEANADVIKNSVAYGLTWNGSKFSGIQNGGAFISGAHTVFGGNGKGCSFDLRSNGGMLASCSVNLNHCIVNFTSGGDEAHTLNSDYITINNTYLSGKMKFNNGTTYCKYSVINAEGTFGLYMGLSNGGICIVNSDIATSYSSAFTAVTTEQLKDASYLSSIGFPIGVD